MADRSSHSEATIQAVANALSPGCWSDPHGAVYTPDEIAQMALTALAVAEVNCDRFEFVDFGLGSVKVRCTERGLHNEHRCEVTW